MNIRLRLFVDAAIMMVVALAAGLVVRFTGITEWPVVLVVAGGGSGFIVYDVMRTGIEGRPLWRWRWLDGPRPD